MTEIELMEQINATLQVLVALRILEIVTACFRGWRIRTLNMGGK